MAVWCKTCPSSGAEISLTRKTSNGCQTLHAKSAALRNYKMQIKTLRRFYSTSQPHVAFRINITHVFSLPFCIAAGLTAQDRPDKTSWEGERRPQKKTIPKSFNIVSSRRLRCWQDRHPSEKWGKSL